MRGDWDMQMRGEKAERKDDVYRCRLVQYIAYTLGYPVAAA